MANTQLDISEAVQDAFSSLISNKLTLALPLALKDTTLQALPAVYTKAPEESFQSNLNLLNDTLNHKTSLYLLLRRDDCLFAITFVPFMAPVAEREMYLKHRQEMAKLLGEGHFKTSLICKEPAEIMDARSWVERDGHKEGNTSQEEISQCEDSHEHDSNVSDIGYKKNKCRLCDRRMKNKITDEALAGLGKLGDEGDCVQISLNSDLVLSLDMQTSSLLPSDLPSRLPTTHPTFTFYRHPNRRLYFIFHSPDSATVQQRMKHTMAIPGLVNVHAEDCGVHVDQKIEIHEPEELVFEESDEKVGKFRSLYLRGGWEGTESQYEGLERDMRFYDAVR
ncbi:Twinfilin-1 [Curvularia kusanoi]|uniref:Twinfilin-1 n=1 Tax=Curvularia kusanoi TaxID=90978 RepID=A0A9P4T647_CURKU|nr:Twinfilin-1 [Curvularia kusanoi]